jgi:hypothetical protein
MVEMTVGKPDFLRLQLIVGDIRKQVFLLIGRIRTRVDEDAFPCPVPHQICVLTERIEAKNLYVYLVHSYKFTE